MKTNFKKDLLEKQIDLKDSCVSGGIIQEESRTISSECTDNGNDSRTTTRDECGAIVQSCFTWK